MEKVRKLISDMKKELDRIRWCKGKELVKNAIVRAYGNLNIKNAINIKVPSIKHSKHW